MLHAPNRATRVIRPAREDFYAGFCRSGCPYNDEGGWFVPYRRVREYTDAYEAVINLCVIDLSSTFICGVPFVIDTGTDVTIVPRRLVSRPHAFQVKNSLGPYKLQGLTGGGVVGLRFNAAMFLPLPQRDLPSLSFGRLKPVVVDHWKDDYGMLGLDALRRVVMVSDREHVSLWPAPSSDCREV